MPLCEPGSTMSSASRLVSSRYTVVRGSLSTSDSRRGVASRSFASASSSRTALASDRTGLSWMIFCAVLD